MKSFSLGSLTEYGTRTHHSLAYNTKIGRERIKKSKSECEMPLKSLTPSNKYQSSSPTFGAQHLAAFGANTVECESPTCTRRR